MHEEGGSCNIDELSAGGNDSSEAEKDEEHESDSTSHDVILFFFNPQSPNESTDKTTYSKCLWFTTSLPLTIPPFPPSTVLNLN